MAFPLIENVQFGTHPMLVHASGKAEDLALWPSLLHAAETWRIDAHLDPDVSAITFNNGGPFAHDVKRLGLFEESLRRNGIDDITVLGKETPRWKNNLKIPLLLDFLNGPHVRKYVLVSDSADVILTNDLGPLIERFTTFGCEAVFNGERRHWPSFLPPFDKEVAPDEYFGCLNSGVWVADAAFARELAAYCAALAVERYRQSDQKRYKIAYRHFYPRMRVDHHCLLFQNINRVGPDVVTLKSTSRVGG